MIKQYSLYGTPFSLYTGKARAYFNYKQIPYEEVFSSLRVYKKVIIPKTGVRFVPVVKTPQGEYLQDTSVIIDTLEKTHTHRPIIPTTPKQRLVSFLIELWADEWLLLAAMHYRWNKANFPFIYQEFGSVVHPALPGFVRTFLGKRIGARFRGFVPLLGITEASTPALEDWYENHVLATLDEHFAEHSYLLGDAASLGDICLMGPLYAHLYRDPVPGKMMREKAPHVAAWVERMNSQNQSIGEWLTNDTIPQALIVILQRMFKEFWPVVTDTANILDNWIEANPQQQFIPRMLGKHEFSLGGVTEKRAVISFNVWKLQRVLDCYHSFDNTEKYAVDELLQQLGGYEAMQFTLKHRVDRVKNRLIASSSS